MYSEAVSSLSDAELLALYKSAKDPFESALRSEGASGQIADIARSIYQQESSSGKNTKTSNAGAVGGMQIIPATFKSVADKDWDINDPVQNARAGIRYVKQLYEQAGGDPALTAAGYYGGPGGLEKARRGVAVSDPRNPNAPNTLQYGQQVAARIPKEKGLIQRGVEAIIPSAEAAESKNPLESMSDEELLAAYNKLKPAQQPAEAPGKVASVAAGLGRGTGNVALNIQKYVGKGAKAVGADQVGDWLIKDAAEGQAKLSAENAPYKEANPISNATGEVGGEILSTLPVGGILKKGVQAVAELPVVSQYAGPVLNRLATALGSSGASVGAGGTAAGNMLLRSLGGAGTGYGTAMLVNEDSGGLGAAMGGLFPVAGKAVGYGANALGSTLRPFYEGGQNRILSTVLRQFADDPAAARTALQSAREVVPGSAPTTVMASGDTGLSALSRAVQNASPEYASNLAARQTAQNQARTSAIEEIAGNTGKLDLAKAARDELTGPMREQVLSQAGRVPVDGVLAAIDRQIADPNNAGRLSQQALSQFRNQIANLSRDGAIDARALYEVRKDIGTVMSGKLQGDAGNLRYARGQLDGVQSIIDDAIDAATTAVETMRARCCGPRWWSSLVKLNIFEGARRIAMLVGGLYAVGVIGWAAVNDPYVSLTFSIPELNAKAVMVESCGDEDAREYLSRKLPDGSKASATLCFAASMSSDGRLLVPYRADAERADMVWMNARYSSDVTSYTKAVADRFVMPPDAVAAYKAKHRSELLDQWKLAAQVLCGGLAVLWAIVALIGWIVRGFLGIPRGRDAAPPPPGTDSSAA